MQISRSHQNDVSEFTEKVQTIDSRLIAQSYKALHIHANTRHKDCNPIAKLPSVRISKD